MDSQKHISVECSPAFVHTHLLVLRVSLRSDLVDRPHEQNASSDTSFAAAGTSDVVGTALSRVHVQPNFVKSGTYGLTAISLFHLNA